MLKFKLQGSFDREERSSDDYPPVGSRLADIRARAQWCREKRYNRFFSQVNPVLPQHLFQFLIPRAEHSGNFLWTAQCRMITTIYNSCCQVPQIACTADSANMTVCEEVFNATLTINLADVIASVPDRALELQDLTLNQE